LFGGCALTGPIGGACATQTSSWILGWPPDRERKGRERKRGIVHKVYFKSGHTLLIDSETTILNFYAAANATYSVSQKKHPRHF